jgi:DNA transformation protein
MFPAGAAMPLSQDFITYATELIEGFGPVEVKRMFGGASLGRDGVGFAILDDDTFFLKADAEIGAELKAAGAIPWVYSIRKDGSVRDIAYWSLPASAADDPAAATALAKRSYAIAVKAAKSKSKSKQKQKPKPKPPTKKAVLEAAMKKAP